MSNLTLPEIGQSELTISAFKIAMGVSQTEAFCKMVQIKNKFPVGEDVVEAADYVVFE